MRHSWQFSYVSQNWWASVPQLAVQLWRTKLVRLSLMSNYGAQKVCTSVGCRTIANKVKHPLKIGFSSWTWLGSNDIWIEGQIVTKLFQLSQSFWTKSKTCPWLELSKIAPCVLIQRLISSSIMADLLRLVISKNVKSYLCFQFENYELWIMTSFKPTSTFCKIAQQLILMSPIYFYK